MIRNKDRKISFVIAVFTFLTLIFCCSHICEAAGTRVLWDESPESNVEGYYIYYGMESGNYTASVQVVGKSSTTYPIANLNLTPGQTIILRSQHTQIPEKKVNILMKQYMKRSNLKLLQVCNHPPIPQGNVLQIRKSPCNGPQQQTPEEAVWMDILSSGTRKVTH